MRISYHDVKRAETLKNRGLDFAHADRVFSKPTLTIEDDREDYGETRYQTVGQLGRKIVMVVWTPRSDARHIISMRKCNAKERERYQIQLDRPG
jgi:uncharacterized DUF497 family protein